MSDGNPLRPGRTLRIREAALALNLTSAVALALVIYGETHGLDYYLRRAAIRVDGLLRFAQVSPVTTEVLRRNGQNARALFAGMELTILVSMFAVMMVILLFLRLSPSAWYRVILGNGIYGFLALFSFPVSVLCASYWQVEKPHLTFEGPMAHLAWLLLALDILCPAVLFLVSRLRPFSAWMIGILTVLHCGLWMTPLAAPLPPELSVASAVASLSFVVFPLSAAVWLYQLKRTHVNAAVAGRTRRVGKWVPASTVASVAVVLAIWYPGRAYSLAHPQNMGSVVIEMSRGPCYGRCPVYSLTLYGDGRVEYRGTEFVRVKEEQTTRISAEQLTQVLRDLDRMHFFTVEDRAFEWCFDTASTRISVSVDGRKKRVTTDGCNYPLKAAPKDRFLEIADEIDTIVDSKQWVQCSGFCQK